ncbi:unnamed protein product [Dovyalis caffra]|uniref:Uncharacterized protein n=1 Tax=Dovyalis caffra TaxID=77055 RepID=A0AAV1S814_9ROSI|nr:unnamed protein product [Dovyalis caffra]
MDDLYLLTGDMQAGVLGPDNKEALINMSSAHLVVLNYLSSYTEIIGNPVLSRISWSLSSIIQIVRAGKVSIN